MSTVPICDIVMVDDGDGVVICQQMLALVKLKRWPWLGHYEHCICIMPLFHDYKEIDGEVEPHMCRCGATWITPREGSMSISVEPSLHATDKKVTP